MYDVNDIAAMEARRQEAAVKAGMALREVKSEPSVFKDQQVAYFDELAPAVMATFAETLIGAKIPGYNEGATLADLDELTPELEVITEDLSALSERLQSEAAENELKVTRTATGQPKVDESGNVVQPLQSETPEASNESDEAREKREKREQDKRDKERQEREKAERNKPTNPIVVPPVVVAHDDKDNKDEKKDK